MESRIEDILSATIGGESYNKPSESRIETLLINLKEQIDDKVDKVSGKGLSTNDFTTAEKTKLDDLAEIKSIGTGLALDDSTGELVATGGSGGSGTLDYTELINKPQINSVILSGNKSLSDFGITYESKTAASDGTTLSLVTTGEKYTWNNKQSNIDDLSTIRSGAALGATAVQPVTGKGLSTNDYTTAEKTKLAGIAEGAEVNEIEGIKVNNTSVNPDANKVVNITVPTTAADVSALPDTTKYAAALSLTINSSTFVMTGQLKDQNGDNLGTAQTIDLPLESVVVGGSYNSQTQKVVLTLQNGNTVEFSVADLVSGLQTELSANNKLNPAYINYDSTHRAVSDTEKSTWNSKQSALTTEQLSAVNSGITSTDVEQITTNKNNILTVADQTTKYNICDYTRVDTAQYPDSSTGATISFDSDSLEYNINGTTNSTGALLSNIYFDTATTKAIPNGEWVAQIFPTLENLQLQIVTNNIFSNGNRPITFTVTDDDTRSWARLYLANNKTFNNAKTKLMIIPKSVWDAGFTDYQPYAMSNVELTAAIQALQAQLSNQ